MLSGGDGERPADRRGRRGPAQRRLRRRHLPDQRRRFRHSAPAADRITDFVQIVERIDLRGIDANTGTAGDQAFSFIGTAAFSATAGELRYAFDGTDTWVQGDVDGDGVADFEIVLSGEYPMVAGDFYL